jgi:hypothetical protein
MYTVKLRARTEAGVSVNISKQAGRAQVNEALCDCVVKVLDLLMQLGEEPSMFYSVYRYDASLGKNERIQFGEYTESTFVDL